jgi:hypothetical protein
MVVRPPRFALAGPLDVCRGHDNGVVELFRQGRKRILARKGSQIRQDVENPVIAHHPYPDCLRNH